MIRLGALFAGQRGIDGGKAGRGKCVAWLTEGQCVARLTESRSMAAWLIYEAGRIGSIEQFRRQKGRRFGLPAPRGR